MAHRTLEIENLSIFGGYLAIIATVLLTVYGQIILRWQVAAAGQPPADPIGRIQFLAGLMLQPWVLSAVAATFIAGLAWMLALTRFPLSDAYPWMGLNYVLVLLLGITLFGEQLTWEKAFGTLLVVGGLVVLARST